MFRNINSQKAVVKQSFKFTWERQRTSWIYILIRWLSTLWQKRWNITKVKQNTIYQRQVSSNSRVMLKFISWQLEMNMPKYAQFFPKYILCITIRKCGMMVNEKLSTINEMVLIKATIQKVTIWYSAMSKVRYIWLHMKNKELKRMVRCML